MIDKKIQTRIKQVQKIAKCQMLSILKVRDVIRGKKRGNKRVFS